MIKIAASQWICIALAIIALIAVAVTTRPAFKQQSNMVVVRLPGHRWFGDPQPTQACASDDLPYAWLSTAVYGCPTSTKPDEKAKFTERKAALFYEWSMWLDFPNADLQAEMDRAHLRAQVWEKLAEPSDRRRVRRDGCLKSERLESEYSLGSPFPQG